MFSDDERRRLASPCRGSASRTAYQSARAMPPTACRAGAQRSGGAPDRPADPLIVHPDIRRMLLTMKAQNEAARALACWIASISTLREPSRPREREAAEDLVAS